MPMKRGICQMLYAAPWKSPKAISPADDAVSEFQPYSCGH
jgi:hypothetical protein